MEPKKVKRETPEATIQKAIIEMLTLRDWYTVVTHGNIYSHGLPDIFAAHSSYGTRWIECKCPYGYSFTPSQNKRFPALIAKRVGIWILIDNTEAEYAKLFEPTNLWWYLQRNCVSGYTCQALQNTGFKQPNSIEEGSWKL